MLRIRYEKKREKARANKARVLITLELTKTENFALLAWANWKQLIAIKKRAVQNKLILKKCFWLGFKAIRIIKISLQLLKLAWPPAQQSFRLLLWPEFILTKNTFLTGFTICAGVLLKLALLN
ncbi:hypothetical protein GGTG_09545 [Gaeumannomyces tritici R3-111a-1]|uniref:Uncharacterized protein n=1 Tax=Gaeumannomyces tritici (strain R3-111a-1) TaxID=644352 RepID=J3P7Q3_GAET3|nr:hypothetical protein GGTG_09545 [Gaeumannomyces tritici R3-111a-1]EJT72686.1 hypothetical protein GGTG_09545 [Gaeumannomyces tritici R3-111a-1]